MLEVGGRLEVVAPQGEGAHLREGVALLEEEAHPGEGVAAGAHLGAHATTCLLILSCDL